MSIINKILKESIFNFYTYVKWAIIARSFSCYGFQKVGYTAENCKWYNLNPDLGVTQRILFS